MEKLTIKPWQVMQAHENGAKIEYSSENAPTWKCINPIWDFHHWNYRIANLTSDGMRLDELVEKFQDEVDLKTKLTANCGSMFFPRVVTKTSDLIVFLCEHPECIYQVKVKQEKKLRPWTMLEFEEHFGEPFIRKNFSKDGDIYRCLGYNKTGVLFPLGINILFEDLFNDYTRFDGSPCGVLE